MSGLGIAQEDLPILGHNDQDSNSIKETKQEPPAEAHKSTWNALWHHDHDAHFIRYIILTAVMLVWPWAFSVAVWASGGIEASPKFAEAVRKNQSAVHFFIPQIGTIVSLIDGILFSTAVTRLAQKWVVHKGTNVFEISFLKALKNHRITWSFEDWPQLIIRKRIFLVIVALFTMALFTYVPSSIIQLLTPVQFNKTMTLTGNEIDFASNDPACVAWFLKYTISNDCDWEQFNGSQYTSCLAENQLINVLDSGRGNILSKVPNNTESVAFGQLGAKDGLHFLGSIRGVLPIGPDGVPAFNTLSPFPTPNGPPRYHYMLDHQGLTSNIACIYDQESPVVFETVSDRLVRYNGTCPTGQDVLSNATFIAPTGGNVLGVWACGPLDDTGESYKVYFRGANNYKGAIGNITCSISGVRPAIYPLSYSSDLEVFSAAPPLPSTSNTSSDLIMLSIKALAGTVYEAQGFQSNIFAESIITYGVKSYNLLPYNKSETYLRLYEEMVEGMIEYEASYIRLLYTILAADPTGPAPSTCQRNLEGNLTYEVLGWHVTPRSAVFLLPKTIVNLSTVGLLFVAMFMRSELGRKKLPRFDPTDPHLIISEHDAEANTPVDPSNPQKWGLKVAYQADESGEYKLRKKKPVFSFNSSPKKF